MHARTTFAGFVVFGLMRCVIGFSAQSQTAVRMDQPSPSPAVSVATPDPSAAAPTNGKHAKDTYTGTNVLAVLPATPMLDAEGKQRVDPDGHLMFNPAVKQIRNKKGHPAFDADGKPVFETATNMGYDEKGKKIAAKKIKLPKMMPVSIVAGTLTVDGWTGKARLNYDIADLKFLYVFAPGIGTTIVSHSPFPGSKEQSGAFNDRTLSITVDGHRIEVESEKRLLAKRPQSAWVAVDRNFLLPAKFPVLGYGTAIKAPYAWPGSKVSDAFKGPVLAPPLPPDVMPALLLTPCEAGMMRQAGPAILPGEKAPVQPCVPISSAASTAATNPAPTTAPSPAQ